jgi:hypothetical protein
MIIADYTMANTYFFTDPDVKDYLIRFLGSNPFNQIRSQTVDSPFGA